MVGREERIVGKMKVLIKISLHVITTHSFILGAVRGQQIARRKQLSLARSNNNRGVVSPVRVFFAFRSGTGRNDKF